MDLQTIINWVLGLLTTILGFFVHAVRQDNKESQMADQTLHQRINRVEVLVAGAYLTRAEHKEDMHELQDHIDRQFKSLREDLKSKADK